MSSSPSESEVIAPTEVKRAVDRPRLFKEIKDLLGVDIKGSGKNALPTPGDQPRLSVGADGKLTTKTAAAGDPEDIPEVRRPKPAQDEDRPE